jgi:hypothetical protein
MNLGQNVTSWAQLTVTAGNRREFIRSLILKQASKYGIDLKSLAQYLGLALFYERSSSGGFAPFGETKAGTIIQFIGLIGDEDSTYFLKVVLSARIFESETNYQYHFQGYYSGGTCINEIGWALGQIGGNKSIEILNHGIKTIKTLEWDFPYSFLVGLCLSSDKNAITDLIKKLESANNQARCLNAILDAYYFPTFLVPSLNKILNTTQDYIVKDRAKRIIENCTAPRE